MWRIEREKLHQQQRSYAFYRVFFKLVYENSKILNNELSLSTIIENASNLGDGTGRWTRTYNDLKKVKLEEKYASDQRNLLSTEERQRLGRRKCYRKVKIMMLSEPETFSVDNFVEFRNYVLINVFLRNAHRPSVAHNLLSETFEEARLEDDRYVSEHKTKSLGSVQIIVNKKFYKILRNFYGKVRILIVH